MRSLVVPDLHMQEYPDIYKMFVTENDLSMFLPEWTRIVMGNAIPELKKCATFVTRDAADDGIAYALRHFGWIE